MLVEKSFPVEKFPDQQNSLLVENVIDGRKIFSCGKNP